MAQYGNRMWMGPPPSGLLGGSDVYRGLVEGMANGFRPSLGGPSADLPPYIDPNAQPMPMPTPGPGFAPPGLSRPDFQRPPGAIGNGLPGRGNEGRFPMPGGASDMMYRGPGFNPGNRPGGGQTNWKPPMGWGAAAGVPPHMIDKTPGGGQTNWKPPMGGGGTIGMNIPQMQGRPNFDNAQPMPRGEWGGGFNPSLPGRGNEGRFPMPGGGQTNWKPPGRGQPFLMPGNPGRGFRG
jgi:hypothetical protein